MDLLWLLLKTGATLASLCAALLLVWAAYYHWSRSEIPRGICQPHMLRFLHFSIVVIFGIDYILWKIGLINEFAFLRRVADFFGNIALRDPKLIIKNVSIKGILVRVYQPKAPQSLRRGIIHIHGGAGIAGSVAAYEKVSRYFAKETDSVVFTVEYGLGPEHLFPMQLEQCLDVTVYLLEHATDYGVDPARVIVCGDSFGSLLAAATCQAVGQRRDLCQPRAQILLFPLLQMVNFNLPSYIQNSNTPLLFKKQILRFGLQFLNRNVSLIDMALEGSHVPEEMKAKYNKWLSVDNIPEEFRKREAKVITPASPFGGIHNIFRMMADPKLSPLLADDEVIQQLPETFIVTCQYDTLRDDGILYKSRLEENGVAVTWHNLMDGFHAVHFFINNWLYRFSCSKTVMGLVVNFIRSV